MFRRSKSADPSPDTAPADAADSQHPPQGKGRPTPTRRDAEAAARARARKPRSRREQMAAQRSVGRGESSQRIRRGIKEGDPKYLPRRDQGPVRAFCRDFVDSRFSLMELMVPILVITLIMGWSGRPYLMSLGSMLTLAALAVIITDVVVLRFRLRRQLAKRFPDESTQGTTFYAVLRALQMRFMRMPKARVKLGRPLPDTYR